MNKKTSDNQNRIDLFGDTTSSSNLFGSSAILQSSLFETTTMTLQSLIGLDKTTSNKFCSEDYQKPSPSNSFLFDPKPSTSTALTFIFGDNQLPTTTNTPFSFSLSKSAITSSPTTLPTLFSTMNRPKASPLDLQLFQTMVNTKPFNNELTFLAQNIKPNVNIDRSQPKTNLYSTILSKSTKRKFNESILDEDDNALFSKINIKRPRMLDMNKVRSVILGNNETYLVQSSTKKFDQQTFRLPRLTHHDYYTEPPIEELQKYFNEQGQCFVKEFTIIRKHYGSVTFQGLHMNLAGLDLDRLVEINRRQVTVYPDEKDRPNEGEELNCQAIISLIGVYPIDRSISHGGEEVTDPNRLIEMNYGKYLEGMTKKFQGHFLDYDVHTGTWTFQVEHF